VASGVPDEPGGKKNIRSRQDQTQRQWRTVTGTAEKRQEDKIRDRSRYEDK